MKQTNISKDLRVQRTNFLLNKALFDLLTEKSFDEINVTDICEKAMVHRATFYKHFEDKFDLANSCIQKLKEKFLNIGETSNNLNLQEYYLKVLDNILTYVDNERIQLKSLFDHNKEGYIYMMIIETLSKNLKEYINNSIKNNSYISSSQSIPQDIKISFVSAGITSLAIWWINNGGKYTKAEMLEYVNKILINNLNKA